MRRVLTILILVTAVGCSTASGKNPVAPINFDEIPKYEQGGPISAPKVISRVEPETSQAFRTKYSFAEAKIEAVIDESGKVVAARFVSGDREWAELLAKAVGRWRFEPATREGTPVAVRFAVSSTFRRSF